MALGRLLALECIRILLHDNGAPRTEDEQYEAINRDAKQMVGKSPPEA